MKTVLLFLLLQPFLVSAQKSYNVIGVAMNSIVHNDLVPNGILKNKFTVVVSDSLFSYVANGNHISYNITKKVNDNYFKATDGLKDYIITIVEQKTGRYNGFINLESDKGVISMFFK